LVDGQEVLSGETSFGMTNQSKFRFRVVWMINQDWFEAMIIATYVVYAILLGLKINTPYFEGIICAEFMA
jgi:hypothetical protein